MLQASTNRKTLHSEPRLEVTRIGAGSSRFRLLNLARDFLVIDLLDVFGIRFDLSLRVLISTQEQLDT